MSSPIEFGELAPAKSEWEGLRARASPEEFSELALHRERMIESLKDPAQVPTLGDHITSLAGGVGSFRLWMSSRLAVGFALADTPKLTVLVRHYFAVPPWPPSRPAPPGISLDFLYKGRTRFEEERRAADAIGRREEFMQAYRHLVTHLAGLDRIQPLAAQTSLRLTSQTVRSLRHPRAEIRSVAPCPPSVRLDPRGSSPIPYLLTIYFAFYPEERLGFYFDFLFHPRRAALPAET